MINIVDHIHIGYYTVARRYDFLLPREHRIHIFEPTCNVLFIICRPDVVDIADFYFSFFEKTSKFYKSPFVFKENTKHPCPGYRNTNWIPIKQNTWNTYQLNNVTRKNWKYHWLWHWLWLESKRQFFDGRSFLAALVFFFTTSCTLWNSLRRIPSRNLEIVKVHYYVLVLKFLGKLILFRRSIKQIKAACRWLLTTNDTRKQVHSSK